MTLFKPTCNICNADLDATTNEEGNITLSCTNHDCAGSTAEYRPGATALDVSETANQRAARLRAQYDNVVRHDV